MRSFLLMLILGLGGAAAPAALGQDQARAGAADPAFETALAEVDAKSATVKDLSARFEQTKKTPLLRKPLVSSGTVRVKGTAARWDTEKPHRTSMLIDEAQIRMYYPDQRTLEVFEVDESMRRITASPLPRLALIREQFDITPADVKDPGVSADPERYVAASLVPREESLRKHVERVLVVIERATGCAVKVEIKDADGDTTTIAFSDIKTNTGWAESDLALVVPAGTKVVKPLQGLRGNSVPERPDSGKPGGGS